SNTVVEGLARYIPLDLPTNGGHPDKSVNSILGGPTWQDRDAPTPRSSKRRPSSSSPSKATPSPRPHAASASTTISFATGNRLSKRGANRPSPVMGSSLPLRKRTAASGPRTSGYWPSATS